MAFESGWAAFDKEITATKERNNTPFSPRLNKFFWKNGDVKILRFLTDEPIIGYFAEWVVTNEVDKNGNPRSDDFLIDPDGPNWVAQFGGKCRERGAYGALVDPKPMKRGVGVAVLRDEKLIDGGRREQFDVVNEFTSKKDNNTYKSRQFGVVKLSMGNFWEQIRGISRRNGTICDRDYQIKRVGEELDTKYEISPIDPIEELRDPEVVRALYGYGRPFNEDDPERYLYCPQTLPQWCEYYSGEERARKLLAPKVGFSTAPQQSIVNPALVQSYMPQQTVLVPPAGLNHQQTVVAPPVQGGSWAGAEDEAQAVPSEASVFTDLRSRLMPHLDSK